MLRKRRHREEDLLRRIVRGILTVVLSALATWLAGKITELILGPAEEPEPEEDE